MNVNGKKPVKKESLGIIRKTGVLKKHYPWRSKEGYEWRITLQQWSLQKQCQHYLGLPKNKLSGPIPQTY